MATGRLTPSRSGSGCDLSCSRLPTTGQNRMKHKSNNSPTRSADHRPGRRPPVRVKLWRADAYMAQTIRQTVTAKNWWKRLSTALGTVSSDFVNASLLSNTSCGSFAFRHNFADGMNAALAMVSAAAPKDEIEAALVVQMACTHTAAMALLAKMDAGFGTERRIVAFGTAAARLMKAYAMQMEVLRRSRIGGHQFVHVEHVHVNDGGQAVVER